MKTHISDPYLVALDRDAEALVHARGCPACARSLHSAERLLASVRAAARTTSGLAPRLPDGGRIRLLARRRRTRRRIGLAAAAVMMLALFASFGRMAEERRQIAMDRADDALLRSLKSYGQAPDVGGLGKLVDAALREDRTQREDRT